MVLKRVHDIKKYYLCYPPTIVTNGKIYKSHLPRFFMASKIGKIRKLQDDFIYIPTTKLHFTREETLQEKNWLETHGLLQQKGSAMPTMLEFVRTLKYLKKKNVELYNEITGVGPWRATWIYANFKRGEDGLYVLTGNKSKSERLDPDTLMEDKRISLESWIAKPTSQGLPRKDTAKGDLSFRCPRECSVAMFGASNGKGNYLYCDKDPSDHAPYLGVHAVRHG